MRRLPFPGFCVFGPSWLHGPGSGSRWLVGHRTSSFRFGCHHPGRDHALAPIILPAHATNALQPSQGCVTPLQRHALKAEHVGDTRARSISGELITHPGSKGAAP